MKNELKEKFQYWTESFLYVAALLLGFTILLGGAYSVYSVLRVFFG